MPCDSTITLGIDLRLSDKGLLMEALEAEGFSIQTSGDTITLFDFKSARQYTIREGKVYGAGDATEIRDRIARAYTKRAIDKVSKKYSWKLSMKSDSIGVLKK